MSAADIRTNQNHTSKTLSEHKLWARVGISLYVSDETHEKLTQGDNAALKDVLLGRDGRVELDGETYFPECWDGDNENDSLDHDFDLGPTPLHEAAEKPPQIQFQSRKEAKPSPLRSFFYTFGTSDTQPFQKGWVEVKAQDRNQADALFRMNFPDRTPGILNCSSVYDYEQFKPVVKSYQTAPDWNICHGKISAPIIQPAHHQFVKSPDTLYAVLSDVLKGADQKTIETAMTMQRISSQLNDPLYAADLQKLAEHIQRHRENWPAYATKSELENAVAAMLNNGITVQFLSDPTSSNPLAVTKCSYSSEAARQVLLNCEKELFHLLTTDQLNPIVYTYPPTVSIPGKPPRLIQELLEQAEKEVKKNETPSLDSRIADAQSRQTPPAQDKNKGLDKNDLDR